MLEARGFQEPEAPEDLHRDVRGLEQELFGGEFDRREGGVRLSVGALEGVLGVDLLQQCVARGPRRPRFAVRLGYLHGDLLEGAYRPAEGLALLGAFERPVGSAARGRRTSRPAGPLSS